MNLLDALCRDWLAIASKDFEPRCCIAAASIGSEALAYFGVRAAPVAADVAVFNAEGFDLQQAGIPVPEWPPTAWSVGVQRAELLALDTPGYAGHLVIIVDDLLIDLSAAQFHRPHKGLICDKPLILDGPTWDDHAARESYAARLEDGSVIFYWLRPEDTTWKAAPDWKHRARHAGPMIRRLRALDLETQPQGAEP